MKLWKLIVLSVVVMLTVIGLITAVSISRQLDDERVCTGLRILMTDSLERQFVTPAELTRLLRTHELYPVGKRLNSISTEAIEDAVKLHPMVRRAECYPTSQGQIQVVLSQRIPLLKVVAESGTYYIDTDRKPMPIRQSVQSAVLIVSGHVGERMAREEIGDFAHWLKRNRYWSRHIRGMRIEDTKHIYLTQEPGEPVILLGELGGYERKLRKLRTFVEKGLNQLPERPQYKELDIRYKDQVIGR